MPDKSGIFNYLSILETFKNCFYKMPYFRFIVCICVVKPAFGNDAAYSHRTVSEEFCHTLETC